jgi:UDP-3-O-[3-hydroxymyristoyl] N-acetylglucosamine deacetylase
MLSGETSAAVAQTTLRDSVAVEGVGLHTGERCRLVMHPAPADAGVVLEATGGGAAVTIPATAEWAVPADRCTALERDGARVATVEHLLAALCELGVDNARVEVSGPECPALDGSARPYVEAIERAGIRDLDAPRRQALLERHVWAASGDSWLIATPARERRVTVAIEFPGLGRQVIDLALDGESFRRELAPARTPAFEEEVESLIAHGLGRGGSLDNVVVVTRQGALRDPRFPDEVARHKALDLLGDLSLAGRVRAHIWAVRPGHGVNLELARKMAAVVKVA